MCDGLPEVILLQAPLHLYYRTGPDQILALMVEKSTTHAVTFGLRRKSLLASSSLFADCVLNTHTKSTDTKNTGTKTTEKAVVATG